MDHIVHVVCECVALVLESKYNNVRNRWVCACIVQRSQAPKGVHFETGSFDFLFLGSVFGPLCRGDGFIISSCLTHTDARSQVCRFVDSIKSMIVCVDTHEHPRKCASLSLPFVHRSALWWVHSSNLKIGRLLLQVVLFISRRLKRITFHFL